MAAASGFDQFLEKNRAILNPENDAVFATCLQFEPVSHRLVAGTNSGELSVWSLCEVIAHYKPALVTTSFVSLGEFLSYKWNPKTQNRTKNNDSVDFTVEPTLLLRHQLHRRRQNDNGEDIAPDDTRLTADAIKNNDNGKTSTGGDLIVSVDCSRLSNGQILVVTAGETDRRCCVSTLRDSEESSSSVLIDVCGDLAYGRPSSTSETIHVGGESISKYDWFTTAASERKNNNDNDNDTAVSSKDDETAVHLVKLHEMAEASIVPGKTCKHHVEGNDGDDDSLEHDMIDNDDDGFSRVPVVLGDFISGTRRSNANINISDRQTVLDDHEITSSNQAKEVENKTNISAYRVMHPDPVHDLTEEEQELQRKLALESRLERALRIAGETTAKEKQNNNSGQPHHHQPRPPVMKKIQTRVGVSTKPGSARRHRTIAFERKMMMEQQGLEHEQNNNNSERTSRPYTSSGQKQHNHHHQQEETAFDDGNYDDDEDFHHDSEGNEIDIHNMTEQQLYEQRLHYQHRLREISRNSRLTDDQIFQMNQRGADALEAHARELREREEELEKEQAERNRQEAEVASIAATIATTRDLTREDKDVAESLPSDLSLSSLLIAAAHERRRLASVQKLPPLFLGPQKQEFAKASLGKSLNSSTNRSQTFGGTSNSLEGIVCGDAMMCGIEERPRTGSQQHHHRPESARRPQTSGSAAPTSTSFGNTLMMSGSLSKSTSNEVQGKSITARERLHSGPSKKGSNDMRQTYSLETPFEEETGASARFTGLRLGSNVLRPSTSSSRVSSARKLNSNKSKPRCVSPPQTAGVASIGREGALTSVASSRNGTPTKRNKLTLSERRDKKIEDYGKQLRSCLKWTNGKANGMPMDKQQLKKQAMLEYNLGI